VQGKIFIPGISETRSDNGAPSATVSANLVNAVNTMRATSGVDFKVYSRKHLLMVTVTGVTAYPDFSVLRSRRDT
jgi:hypothetical protein